MSERSPAWQDTWPAAGSEAVEPLLFALDVAGTSVAAGTAGVGIAAAAALAPRRGSSCSGWP